MAQVTSDRTEQEEREWDVWCAGSRRGGGGVSGPKKATSVLNKWRGGQDGRSQLWRGPSSAAVLHFITCRRLDIQHGQRGEFSLSLFKLLAVSFNYTQPLPVTTKRIKISCMTDVLSSDCSLCTVAAYGVDMHHGKVLRFPNSSSGLHISERLSERQ